MSSASMPASFRQMRPTRDGKLLIRHSSTNWTVLAPLSPATTQSRTTAPDAGRSG